MNDRAALDLLVEHGPLSRTALGRLTGLSHPTATRLLARLEQTGLVIEAGYRGSRKGPHSKLYALNPDAAHVAALDVTPAGIDVAVMDLAGTTVATSRLSRRAAPGKQAPERVRRAVAAAVGSIGLDVAALAHVAIGTPGSIDPRTRRLAYARHLPGWHDTGVADAIEAELGIGVTIENDVNLATIAEHELGAARGLTDFVLFWMGEGLGLGIVMDGALRRGAGGGAGEVSYQPVPGIAPSRSLRHGGHGGFQSSAGAEAITVLARAHGIGGKTAEATLRAGRRAGGAGRPFLTDLGRRVAHGLAAAVSLLDPEAIIVSGPVGLAGGPELVELVAAELTAITITTPRVLPGAIEGNAVQAGATIQALTAARQRLFTTA